MLLLLLLLLLLLHSLSTCIGAIHATGEQPYEYSPEGHRALQSTMYSYACGQRHSNYTTMQPTKQKSMYCM